MWVGTLHCIGQCTTIYNHSASWDESNVQLWWKYGVKEAAGSDIAWRSLCVLSVLSVLYMVYVHFQNNSKHIQYIHHRSLHHTHLTTYKVTVIRTKLIIRKQIFLNKAKLTRTDIHSQCEAGKAKTTQPSKLSWEFPTFITIVVTCESVTSTI